MNSVSPQYPLSPETDAARIAIVQRKRWGTRRVLLLALLLGLLLLGYKLTRIGLAGWRAYQTGMELRQQVQSGSPFSQLPQVAASLDQLSTAVTDLEQESRLFAPILHNLTWVPKIGTTLASLPELLLLGRELISLANEGTALVSRNTLTPDDLNLDTLLTQISATPPERWTKITQHAENAQHALTQIPVASLPAVLSERLALLQSFMPVMIAAVHSAPVAPQLLGQAESRTYLVLVQNNHELRATGGFISAVGVVTITQGQLAGLDFQDSYDYVQPGGSYPAAPKPLQRYMNIPVLLLRDANWSPDFPTTAAMVRTLYAYETGVNVAGVVSVDLHAAQLLMDALGPLSIPGSAEPMTGVGFVDQIKQFWRKPIGTNDTKESAGFWEWWEQRKNFISVLAKAAINRVQSGDVDYINLAQATLRALDERAIQIWLADATVAEELATLGWDGALNPAVDSDYWALIDTNVGYNKVNAAVQHQVSYQVEWLDGPTLPALATLSITYTHPISIPNYVCTATPEYGDDYDYLVKRCFYNYVRLYVPSGSKLLAVEGILPDSMLTQRAEKKTQLFAGYFVLPVGQQQIITFRYRLPSHLTPQNYALVIQRQSGSGPLPIKLSVNDAEFSGQVEKNRFDWKLPTEAQH